MNKYTNQLIHETSPYLLQHAHNPVNWYPWGDEALQKAKQESKPILVSIGYAACHWCHVMERESFEDETTARLMNENFINIKIDREERPDLDHIYMDAVQAMTGSGGWPLNVFLTPDAKPFYGGTYFPPQRAFNRPSWQETLLNVIKAFNERRHEIDAQAENLTEHLFHTNSFVLNKSPGNENISVGNAEEAFQSIMKQADRLWGGFGRAPKFPQTFSIQFLLRYHHISGNKESLDQALLSLDKMIEGGIYDQIGGGFARYATDTEWLAPHFEKMLYDNALLVSVLCEAYQLTKKERYREVVQETMQFVERELMHPDGGFYSALDADSEEVEGKFYVWKKAEVDELLGENSSIFSKYYDVTEKGNWEHSNILRVKKSAESFAEENKIKTAKLKKILADGRAKLLEQRKKRVRPALDDKIILGWNALMNTACSKAFGATGNETYRQLAVKNMNFLFEKLSDAKSGGFCHTWKNDKSKFPAFLDDYAFLIQALIHLQEITADTDYLYKAQTVTEFVIEHFSEKETGFFFYTAAFQTDIIIRKKEVYDGATASGNSVMAHNLLYLSVVFDKSEWKQRNLDMVSSLTNAITRYPASFGNWLCLLYEIMIGTNEIAIVGPQFSGIQSELLSRFIPHRVLMASGSGNPGFPLLADKPMTVSTGIWLCSNYTCQPPVFSVNELISLINRHHGRE
ncbi:MAG: thioredoxin domain-containing protein [Sphingobacteriales bacterium]|nr:thioredoxin domain-containing protein [Sphingobacteriales bacterium]